MKALSESAAKLSAPRFRVLDTNGTSNARPVRSGSQFPTPRKLEAVPHTNLYLPGIAKPIANRPVKVEQQRRRRRIPEIVAIQNVEYFNQRLELTAPSQTDGDVARCPLGWLLMHFSDVGCAE